MVSMRLAVLLALVSGRASGLKVDLAKVQHAPSLVSKVAPTQADVNQLHKKLETMAGGLESSLAANDGAMAKTKTGKEVAVFAKELEAVLAETKSMSADPTEAMRKLEAAKAGVAGLSNDMTSRQEVLMKEDEAQKDSLLLGILMTKQKESMAKQLEILRSQDFADLPVTKALLARYNRERPLFQQAGDYLDQHARKATTAVTTAEAGAEKAADAGAKEASKEAAIKAVVSAIQPQIDALEKVYAAREKEHEKHSKELEEKAKAAPSSSKHKFELMLKRENRNFDKAATAQKHDIDTLKSALVAIKKGDMKAVGAAMASLEGSMKSLQSKNGGFLVFLELGARLEGKDCPFCAAQCVNTCHVSGKPYTQCLTDCADAGLSK